MRKKTNAFITIVVCVGMLLSACNFPFFTSATEEADAEQTSVAETVVALQTQQGDQRAGEETEDTGEPTEGEESPQPPTEEPGPSPTPGEEGCIDRVGFVADVTIPDDTFIDPGDSFTKTWRLKNLGTYINYNGYGSSLDDLHFEPAALYRLVSPYAGPFEFMEDSRADFEKLETGFRDDMAAAASVTPERAEASSAVFMFPNEAWARRVSGVYSNDLANLNPDRAHAVLTAKSNGNYLVSVRAPLSNKTGADELCMRFPTGGGRKAAAGVNDLPEDMLDDFMDQFADFYR